MTITIRAAGAHDIDFLCWVMFTAAKSHLDRCMWEMIFDMSPADTMAFLARVATTEATHWCHQSKFLVAEIDGVAAGALCTFDPTTEGTAALSDAMLSVATQLDRGEGWLESVLNRALIVDAATPKDYPSAWGVENVAVKPEFRGKGVVEALFARALEIAKASGREHAQILCLNGNVRALKAWERQDFELRADYRSAIFEKAFGSAGLKLLARNL